jgi:endonuclease YncB( thermonuclease family)
VKAPGSSFRSVLLIVCLLLLATSCRLPPKQTERGPNVARAISLEQTISGRVVRVADGDTITVLDGANEQHRIRLKGIDAPESHQDFGAKSKQSLSSLIFGKEVTVGYDKTDQYGRLVGKVLLDGKDINLEQVKAGMAWHYKDYDREQTPEDRELYARAEAEARAARRGLWIDANPVAPSEFRKEQREERKAAR